MELRSRLRRVVLVGGMAVCISVAGLAPAEAFKFDWGEDWKFAIDTTLTYGLASRTDTPAPKITANINNDDGDRNFSKKWDLINNRVSGSIDIDANYRKNFGVFIRPRAFYDFAYTGSNHNDSPKTNNNGPVNGGPLVNNTDFSSETIKINGRRAEILDAFAYGTFDLGGHNVLLRVGQQAVNWGESLFLQGGISTATTTLDLTQANVPGVEIKDIVLPVGQVYSSIELGRGLTLAGYYQWQWRADRTDESGAFFNNGRGINDGTLNAGERLLIPTPASLAAFPYPTVDRVGDQDPSNSGQFGVALRYLAKGLNNTEFGLYFVNYHDKLPEALWNPTGGTATPGFPILTGAANAFNVLDLSTYHFRWEDNIRLWGASFSTMLGSANVAGEFSYRANAPVQMFNPAISPVFKWTYDQVPIIQGQLSTIYAAGSSPLWNNLTFTGEVGFNQVNGASNAALFWDKFAWGFTAKAALDYFQILEGIDLNVPLIYKAAFHNSVVPATFVDHADSFSVGTTFTYHNVWVYSLAYTGFINGAGTNPNSDRDFLSTSLKYTF